jgi:hypothetical protein
VVGTCVAGSCAVGWGFAGWVWRKERRDWHGSRGTELSGEQNVAEVARAVVGDNQTVGSNAGFVPVSKA